MSDQNTDTAKVTKYIKPVLIGLATYVGWKYLLTPLLETFGLKDSKSDRELEKLKGQVESRPALSDYWKPTFFQSAPVGYTALILTQAYAESLARRLYTATGIFNDEETKIYAVFRELKYRTQVSYLAYTVNRLYQKDLYSWLDKDVLNDNEFPIVLQITEKLPNGFHNTRTGQTI